VVFVQGQAIVAPFNKTVENVLETISLMVRRHCCFVEG
jgi:hypothetical protein